MEVLALNEWSWADGVLTLVHRNPMRTPPHTAGGAIRDARVHRRAGSTKTDDYRCSFVASKVPQLSSLCLETGVRRISGNALLHATTVPAGQAQLPRASDCRNDR